jgi:hypothetical protein
MTRSLVITGLVPVIPILMALRFSKRDGRHKAGHNEEGHPRRAAGEGRGSRAGWGALFPPPCGEGLRVGVAKSKLCCFNEEHKG